MTKLELLCSQIKLLRMRVEKGIQLDLDTLLRTEHLAEETLRELRGLIGGQQ